MGNDDGKTCTHECVRCADSRAASRLIHGTSFGTEPAIESGMWNLARRLLLPLCIILLLAGVALIASQYASSEWLVERDASLRRTIRAHPVPSFLIGFVAYLLLSLIPGTAGKSIVLGWFFGLLGGVVIVNGALVLASLVTFVVGRHFLHALVQARLKDRLQPVQKRMQQDGAFYLLTLRLAHAPFSIVNYAAAAGTDVSLGTFWWTTQLGLLPGNIVFVFAGTRLPALEELVRVGPLGVLDGPMVLALLSTVLVPWLIRRLFHIAIPMWRSAQQLR